ncbi:MAG: CD225/dispanin family protein [Bacteroidales bacterium]|jgi:uncharacterized integral membrane protein|nr:CD225/dispanin family protein [Bacteroidales bacterium]
MKHCTQCGEQNLDNASFCSKCGASLYVKDPSYKAPGQYVEVAPQNPNYHYDNPQQPSKPPMSPTYLWQSIVVTIICCMPLGIPAIVNASQVETRYLQGNYEGSLRASRNAKSFCMWGLIAGIVGTIAYILLMIFGIAGGSLLDSLNYY